MNVLYHTGVLILTAVCAINVTFDVAFAHGPTRTDLSANLSVTGIITALKRNRVIIINDKTRRKESFIYFAKDRSHLKPGDHVRIYFQDRKLPVVSVIPLKHLEYSGQQNLGYISGSP